MPSKKRTTRPTQSHPLPTQSDYDTDTAHLTDNQMETAALPAPPPRSNAELNLLVLQRWCPEIEHIIAIAPFAVLYLFSPETQQWEKCDTQGSLFVCQLFGAPYPRYRVVILNRKNLENFIYDIVSMDDIEITDEYVIVQIPGDDGALQIYGIWIFSDGDTVPDIREVIAKTVEYCAAQMEQPGRGHELDTDGAGDDQYPAHANKEPVQSQQPQLTGHSIDLATLFAKPQPEVVDLKQHQRPISPNQHFRIEPPEHRPDPGQPPPSSTASDTDFFRRASNFKGQQQMPHAAPPSQKTQLLDLFRNAKRG